MEVHFFCSFFLASLLLLVLIPIRRLKGSTQRRYSNAKPPPGPWKLPIVGSIHHLVGALPHHRLRDLSRKYGPVMLLKLGEVSTVVVSSPEAAKEILKTHDVNFATRPVPSTVKPLCYVDGSLTGVFFAPYGEYWRELRKMCVAGLLATARVQSFRRIREEEVLINLIGQLRSVERSSSTSLVNLSGRLFALANDITCRAVIGGRCKDQETLLRYLAEIVEAVGGFSLADLFPSSRLANLVSQRALNVHETHRKVDRILDGIIREHEEMRTKQQLQPAEEDFVDVLLRIQEQGNPPFPLTRDIIKLIVLDMFAAGSETTATTLDWAMLELMRNPKVKKRAQTEVREVLGPNAKVAEEGITQLSYLKLVIKETLRLHPPGPFFLRESQEPCQVMGYDIAEKTRVLVNVWAIGRDPQIWGGDAEEFRPERFDGRVDIDFKVADFEYMPFGAGRRICPGVAFALATVELVLASLLYYFDWELPMGMDCSELDVTEVFGASVHRKSELYVHCIPQIRCPVA